MNGVEDLIRKLGYEPLSSLKTSEKVAVWRLRRSETDLVLKVWQGHQTLVPQAVHCYRFLPFISRYHQRLVLPQYYFDGFDAEAGHYVVMSFVAGKGYEHRWHYHKPDLAGGLKLALRDIDIIVSLLLDLSHIACGSLVSEGLPVQTAQAEAHLFKRRLGRLEADGHVGPSFSAAAVDLVNDWLASSRGKRTLVLSNTDFRFRNFIELNDEHTALIDWDGARCSEFELEHCVAYQWLFLWKRPDLQDYLLRKATEILYLSQRTFKAVLLMRSIIQAYTSLSHSALSRIHLLQAEHALQL